MKSRLFLAIAIPAALAGCASAPTNPQDPLEPMNRAIDAFNDKADRWIAKPAAQAYQSVTPKPVQTGIGNFFGNIADAYSAMSNLLRAEPEKTLNDVMRVALNSTFGLFGLIDIATPAGLKSNKNGLGDTFASWGWKNSSYLVLPLLGPSTIRDGLATGITVWKAPDRNIYDGPAQANTAWGIGLLDKRARLLSLGDMVDEAALDRYSYTRDAWLQIRANQTGATLPAATEDLGNIDDIMGAPQDASAPTAQKQDASAAQ